MANLADLFNPLGAVEVKTQRNQDEYKVDYKDSKTGVYESIIRFIPNVQDPSRCIAAKRISWVQNPITQVGMYVDDPQSVGQPSPVVDMYFRCYKTNSVQIQEFAKKHISTRQNYAALVQIIKDTQHPELEGQIKIFKFGKKLWDKVHAEEHPAMGEGVNPFHPIYGRYFYIKCTGVAGFNNFDNSGFMDNRQKDGSVINGFYYKDPAHYGDKFVPVTENSDQQAVADYLVTASPDLGKYYFQPWTPEQEKHVNETLAVIANYVQGGGNLQANLQTLATPAQSFSAVPASTPNTGIPVNNNPVFPGATMPTPAPAPAMGGISLGESTLPGVAPAAPSMGGGISGIDMPTVPPTPAPGVGFASPGSGIGGNLDDIIAQL